MSEEPPSTPHRSWFERITHAFSGEVQSREELVEELRLAHANGLLSNDTLAMLEGAIAVADLTVADVMVPRSEVVDLAIDAPIDEVLAVVVESGHSRFPVHGAERDDILGILLAKDLLRCFRNGSGCDLRTLLRPATLIPAAKRLNILLKEFRLSRNHMAVVVDEYGGVAGLVTIEDVLEQIVGDIDDEHDDDDEGAHTLIQHAPNGDFLVSPATPLEEFNERFGCELGEPGADTVGALVAARLGHPPEPGEEASIGGFHFHMIARNDNRRPVEFAVRVHEA